MGIQCVEETVRKTPEEEQNGDFLVSTNVDRQVMIAYLIDSALRTAAASDARPT
jgi:hypothetical protein